MRRLVGMIFTRQELLPHPLNLPPSLDGVVDMEMIATFERSGFDAFRIIKSAEASRGHSQPRYPLRNRRQ